MRGRRFRLAAIARPPSAAATASGLPFKGESVTFQSSNQLTHRRVSQAMNQLAQVVHNVAVTTSELDMILISSSASSGKGHPFSDNTSRYACVASLRASNVQF